MTTHRTTESTWWQRHGGWMILAGLIVLWLLPVPDPVRPVGFFLLSFAAVRLSLTLTRRRAAEQQRKGGAR